MKDFNICFERQIALSSAPPHLVKNGQQEKAFYFVVLIENISVFQKISYNKS